MTAFMKQSWREVLSAVCAFVALVVVLISGATGYLAGNALNYVAICSSVVALVAIAADAWLRARTRSKKHKEKLSSRVLSDVLLLVAVAALSTGLAGLIIERVPLAADIYFIPVNHPAAEGVAMNMTFVAVAFYAVAIIFLIAEAFAQREGSDVTRDEQSAK